MPSDKITCPWCEKSFDLDLLESADLWRERSDLAARLGAQAWKLVNEYADSFRSSRDARITLKRRIAILNDLASFWKGCVFEYDGKRYRTDQRSILDALQAVCSAVKTGSTNHNYLKRVLMGPERQAKLRSPALARPRLPRRATHSSPLSRQKSTAARWQKSYQKSAIWEGICDPSDQTCRRAMAGESRDATSLPLRPGAHNQRKHPAPAIPGLLYAPGPEGQNPGRIFPPRSGLALKIDEGGGTVVTVV